MKSGGGAISDRFNKGNGSFGIKNEDGNSMIFEHNNLSSSSTGGGLKIP
jgi:hypothetical protein